ncbi:rRNA-processing protein UTP23 homolog [Panulirus ornatus]|uniref:rRNA-processing protein UTP23 homolog n=1 Tax=Panulirus ornatus TaxID=150431 RepID=UPI003A837B53
MNTNRLKKAQRILDFFHNNFGLHPPYNVLVDGTFCRTALEEKLQIKEQIPKYLGAQLKLVTTQCIIMEVEKLIKINSNLYGAWLVVKQFPVHKCGHAKNPIPASSCIKSLLKKRNPAKYIVASQDDDLCQYIHRRVVGAPILYLHYKTPTLEKPTEKCLVVASKKSKTLTVFEENTLKSLKRKYIEDDQQPRKKRKKPKNPNSLSCKKSKKVKLPQQGIKEGKRKRKRHRTKKISKPSSTISGE